MPSGPVPSVRGRLPQRLHLTPYDASLCGLKLEPARFRGGLAARLPRCLRQQVETPAMLGTDHSEVTVIQGDEDFGTQVFGQGYHRGIRTSEGEIGVLFDQLPDPGPVLDCWRLDVEALESPQEARFGHGASAAMDQVGGLGNAEGGNYEVKSRRPQRVEAGMVRRVGRVRRGDEGTGVNDRDRDHQPSDRPAPRPIARRAPYPDHGRGRPTGSAAASLPTLQGPER